VSARYVAALDQGTTSTRCILFDRNGLPVASDQMEHTQVFPQAGWVEHDPDEIWENTRRVMAGALAKADVTSDAVVALGITNQRETTVVWDRSSGRAIGNAVVWQDTRTAGLCDELAAGSPDGSDRFVATTGLPLATYFSGPKARWLLDHTPGARHRAEAGELAFGTIDTWVLYNLTGGRSGGVHVTDPTNASRTQLMDLATLQWDAGVADAIGVPTAMLPRIASSSEVYGQVRGASAMAGVPVAGILGDQQAALFGQGCLSRGETKSTYGTGQFVLMNTGTEIVRSANGLISTVAYRLGTAPPVYALEGSVAVSGSLVQWLRDNLQIIDSAPEVERLAASVPDNGGAYIVPAFSGLFAPHWRSDARGVIAGLTRFVTKAHLARAALEAVAYQTHDVVEAMNSDSGVPLSSLKVDGGMVGNELLMQFQADVLDVPVIRPRVTETTALGAAYAAGLAVGFWSGPDDLRANWAEDTRWLPSMDAAERDRLVHGWQKALQRTLDWVE
jgi:glycerol kinase